MLNFAPVSWDGLLVLITGVCFTAIAILKKEQKLLLPSAAIAYVLFSTAGGIGFDLGRGNFQSALDGGSSWDLFADSRCHRSDLLLCFRISTFLISGLCVANHFAYPFGFHGCSIQTFFFR